MKRRTFIKAAAGVTALASSPLSTKIRAQETEGGVGREHYEWRVFHLKDDAQRKVVDAYLVQAAIPAWNRLGIKPVGVFTEMDESASQSLYVLIPYPSLESFSDAAARLAEDKEYLKAGAPYLKASKAEPAYERIENSLMIAFSGMPKIQTPATTEENKPRLFELRTYESHSEEAGRKKVQMFDKGEIEIMKRVGLAPVFYGRMLVGQNLPNLTYMLSAENVEAHKQHWAQFGADEDWKRMKVLPEYADTVSNITNQFLVPTPYSQI